MPVPTGRLGLIIFLVVVSVLFLLLTAYIMRMGFGDWVPLDEPRLLWVNTLALVLSSAAFQRAEVAEGKHGASGRDRTALVGGLFAVAFPGQLVAWRQLDALGYYVASNPANTFFYLLSALHGVHLLGGLVAWGQPLVSCATSAGAAEAAGDRALRPLLALPADHMAGCSASCWRTTVGRRHASAGTCIKGRTLGGTAAQRHRRNGDPVPGEGWQGWSRIRRPASVQGCSWGKAMMWLFLLSDTFVFGCFLTSYMTVRMSTTVAWPNPSEVFALTIGGASRSS